MPEGCDAQLDERLDGDPILTDEKWTLSRVRPSARDLVGREGSHPVPTVGGVVITPEKVRRAGVRDIPRLAMVATRAIEAHVGDERLAKMAALLPRWRPARLALLLAANVLMLAGTPCWFLRARGGEAVVGAYPMRGPGRASYNCRRVGPAVAVLGTVLVVGVPMFLAPPVVQVTGGVSLVGLVRRPVWRTVERWWDSGLSFVRRGLRRRPKAERQAEGLRARRRDAVRAAPGPVWFAAGLAAEGDAAGVLLVAELVAEIAKTDITVVARTEARSVKVTTAGALDVDGPLVTLYQRCGFVVAGRRRRWWGVDVLMVRPPGPHRRLPPRRGLR